MDSKARNGGFGWLSLIRPAVPQVETDGGSNGCVRVSDRT